MAAATDLLERKAGPAADAAILAGRRIPADEATPAGKRIPVDAVTPAGSGTPADGATLADNPIPAAAATPADNGIPAAGVILAGRRFPADAATRAVVGTTVEAMIEDEAGGIEAGAALALGTTRHLTRTAPATTISPTIAIPTAITISGATGILQPLAATPIRTKDINAAC